MLLINAGMNPSWYVSCYSITAATVIPGFRVKSTPCRMKGEPEHLER